MINATYLDKDGNVVRELTQWDFNQTLKLDLNGYRISGSPAIHFCNCKSTQALVVAATNGGQYVTAKIPNSLLREPYQLLAYLYVTEADTSAKSVAYLAIPLKTRPKPAGYEYTDDSQVIMLTDLIAQVNAKIQEANMAINQIKDNIATLADTKSYIG